MDMITINEAECRTHIGVTEDERSREQRVTVSVSFLLNTREAARADDVAKTIDYEAALSLIRSLMQEERRTIERLAEDIAAALLRRFTPDAVEVTVRKFVLPETKDVSVTITRP